MENDTVHNLSYYLDLQHIRLHWKRLLNIIYTDSASSGE